ncbi:polysaccharide deacetylase family protein [Pseudoduganella albidiflava]|uniref:Polysaccharide deacetylase n=1 Tax=Pseudoduganella albidiflava TaxID=321983 RepID=A0AA88C4D7_9BURK|nr:polysaccharide deacetylase family protein [Pseudoduganella albidiflava]GGY53590.1 polysaccharide deacetylase [Pseudoduganella albidiflava]
MPIRPLFCFILAAAAHLAHAGEEPAPAPIPSARVSTPSAPAPIPSALAAPAPIRFLLSFDDGPSGSRGDNSTARVLDTLDHNAVQDGIKAVFFTQTRHWHGGGTETGRALIRREHAAGHVVALHSATALHSNHRFMAAAELDESLRRGVDDLRELTGNAPRLVRPPFWAYDAATLEGYHRHGLRMLLTDLNANDGKIWGVNFSWHKRSNMLRMLADTRARWAAGTMQVVDGHTPVIVTFHDVNTYTARNLEVYLRILVDVARELDMPVAGKPFYDDHDALERAALASTVNSAAEHPRLPGLWNWLWQ